jgi:RNA polymerase sigma factor (sigma-70 family)
MMQTMPADAVSGGDRGGSDPPAHPADAVRHDAAGREGVEERLAAVYRAEVRRLVALGRMLTGDAAAGEDLAHETFLVATRMCRRDPDYLREPVWPWLRTTLTRLAIRRKHRSIGELRRLVHLYERPREDAWSGGTIDFLGALMTLPPRQRAVAALFYGEDMSTEQVAQALGTSVRTVETQLRDARRRLAPRFAADTQEVR